MAFHTKYRPRTLKTVKGNSNLVKTLDSLLVDEDRPHSFLLHGPTGCGKTTLARIIASRLECVGTDLREINSADFRGIDTIRDLYSKSQFKPIEGPCRVWIIDECHKMTNDAQNALLKILEEPPSYVYFILCTTDPQKLLAAIKGRCSQFQVKPLSENEMTSLLQRVVKKEDEELEDEIYEIIIRDSLGLPRNALQILEQVLRTEPAQRKEVAQQAAAEQSESIELCRVLINDKATWKQVQAVLNRLRDQEAESIRRVVLGYCQAVLLKSDHWRAGAVLEAFIEPFYDSGFPQLVYACYSVIKTK